MEDSHDVPQAIGPVERVLNVLTCFSVQGDGLSLTDLARQTNLPPSTTSRLLKVLEQQEFIKRGPNRLYHLGPQIIQLGLAALRDMSLYELARPHLHILAEETGESAHLGIPVAKNVLYVDEVASRHIVQTATWMGRMVPIENTAIGSAIQGQVSSDGYTSTRHTIEPDVSSVAAPIRDKNNSIIGAINIIGPSYRISDEQLTQMGLLVAEHAHQVSTRLGATLR